MQLSINPVPIEGGPEKSSIKLQKFDSNSDQAVDDNDPDSNAEKTIIPHNSILQEEQRIVEVTDKIDAQILQLDNRLDMVLEKNETDFLAAYRFHMVKIQNELVEMRDVGNTADLQKKQDRKTRALDQQIDQYKTDCMQLMRYCQLQKAKVADYEKSRREMNEDQRFLDEQKNNQFCESVIMKRKIAELINENKDHTEKNYQMQNELQELKNASLSKAAQNSAIIKGHQPDFLGQKENFNRSFKLEDKNYVNRGVVQQQSSIPFQSTIDSSLMVDMTSGPFAANSKISYDTVNVTHQNLKPHSQINVNNSSAEESSQQKSGMTESISFDQKRKSQPSKSITESQELSKSSPQNTTENPDSSFIAGGGQIINSQRGANLKTDKSVSGPNQVFTTQTTTIPSEPQLHQHTLLKEKYFQEAQAQLDYKPKFSKPVPGKWDKENLRGPDDIYKPHNYHQKLTNHIKKSVSNAGSDPNIFASHVQSFFQENLLKKFNQISRLKQQIALQQAKSNKQRPIIQEQKYKVDQRNLSRTLTTALQNSVDQILSDKQNRIASSRQDPTVKLKLKDLNRNDKKHILEKFVENDDALGQLLDFISGKYLPPNAQNSGSVSQQQMMPVSLSANPTHNNMTMGQKNDYQKLPGANFSQVSMSIVDKAGNRIVQDKDHLQKRNNNTNLLRTVSLQQRASTHTSKSVLASQKSSVRNHNALNMTAQFGTTDGDTELQKQKRRIQSLMPNSTKASQFNPMPSLNQVISPKNQNPVSRGDESVGVESGFKIKGRGSDFNMSKQNIGIINKKQQNISRDVSGKSSNIMTEAGYMQYIQSNANPQYKTQGVQNFNYLQNMKAGQGYVDQSEIKGKTRSKQNQL